MKQSNNLLISLFKGIFIFSTFKNSFVEASNDGEDEKDNEDEDEFQFLVDKIILFVERYAPHSYCDFHSL